MYKSANQLWRESGTTLSFKNWLNREKEKYANADGSSPLMMNVPLQDTIRQATEDVRKAAGYKTQADSGKVFGINQAYIIIGGLIIVGAAAYYFYNRKKG